MSLEEEDLDDLDFDAARGCGTWAAKLGAAYPCVGTLSEFPERLRVPREAMVYDPNAPSLERRAVAPAPAGTVAAEDSGVGALACPITGAEGAACPLGFGGGAASPSPSSETLDGGDGAGGGECPFPWIFLHDPARGWELHRGKLLTSQVTAAAIVGVAALGFAALAAL